MTFGARPSTLAPVDAGHAAWSMTVTGTGPALVLLHGLGATRSTWDAVVPLLAERFTVVSVDLPGHGESTFDDHHAATLASLADDLERALAARGIGTFSVVGHSFGGALAIQYAMAPGRVPAADRVVLIDAGGLGPEISVFVRALGWPGAAMLFDGLYSRQMTRTFDGVRRGPAGALLAGAGSGAANLQDVLRNLANPLTRTAMRHYLSFSVDGRGQTRGLFERDLIIEHPTLIVWGEDDLILPVRQAYRAHRRLPGSKLVVLPGVGHCPPKQAPAAVAEAIAGFAG